MRKLTIPDALKEEFATAEALWQCTGTTRRVDALIISWVKYEKQLRRLFSFFVFQHEKITEETLDEVVSAFVTNSNLYPETFIEGIEALGITPIPKLIGNGHASLPAHRHIRTNRTRRRLVSPLTRRCVMSTESVAKRLVALCREGKYEDAQKELYSQDAESIEPAGSPSGTAGNVKGLDAIFEKGRQFQASIVEVHGGHVSDPVVAGNWFSLEMTLDVTMKEYGRVNMTEICVYHVNKDGKIDREQFFYDMGG